MKKYKMLHVFNDPKFSKNFFAFLIQHDIDISEHFLFHYRCKKSTCNNFGMRAIFSPSFFSIIPNLLMLRPLFNSEKIIIHSLASPFLLLYLYFFPSLTKKAYWVIWGKDLYFYKMLEKKYIHHRIYEFFRKKVIPDIDHIVTCYKGDYKLAKKWYGTSAKWHKSFMYPSNLYKDIAIPCSENGPLVILLGNSADPSNNHIEVFSLLEKYRHEDINIIVPLSYGNKNYAKKINKLGLEIFADKFIALHDFLPLSKYLEILKTVDIAIFAHRRQQATGNIITLLGMQKKVYIRTDITTWEFLNDLKLKVYDLEKFSLENMEEKLKQKNNQIIKDFFSEKNLLQQWEKISNDKPIASPEH